MSYNKQYKNNKALPHVLPTVIFTASFAEKFEFRKTLRRKNKVNLYPRRRMITSFSHYITVLEGGSWFTKKILGGLMVSQKSKKNLPEFHQQELLRY